MKTIFKKTTYLGFDGILYPAKAELTIEDDGTRYISLYDYYDAGNWINTEERDWTEEEINYLFKTKEKKMKPYIIIRDGWKGYSIQNRKTRLWCTYGNVTKKEAEKEYLEVHPEMKNDLKEQKTKKEKEMKTIKNTQKLYFYGYNFDDGEYPTIFRASVSEKGKLRGYFWHSNPDLRYSSFWSEHFISEMENECLGFFLTTPGRNDTAEWKRRKIIIQDCISRTA